MTQVQLTMFTVDCMLSEITRVSRTVRRFGFQIIPEHTQVAESTESFEMIVEVLTICHTQYT